MASNDDNSRPDKDRPMDNPFIAFRRSVDSQVSSLFNSLAGLPAMIASPDNIQNARTKCLFTSNKSKNCKEIVDLDERIDQASRELLRELPELFLGGDAEAASKKMEDFMELTQKADRLSREILDDQDSRSTDQDAQRQSELIERVGREKGQRWGWSWDWGFPRPFDAEEPSECDQQKRERRQCHRRRRRHARNDAEADRSQLAQAILEAHGVPASDPQRPFHKFRPSSFPFGMDPYSPLALEENEELRRAGVQWRDAYEDLVRAEYGAPLIPEDQRGRSARMPYHVWENRIFVPFHRPLGAQSHLSGEGLECLLTEQEKRSRFEQDSGREAASPAQEPQGEAQTGPFTASAAEDTTTNEEPSYEYGHDHEDQHDEPPTPKMKQTEWTKDVPVTELDAYERLLGSVPSAATSGSSILSTLTTTERTIAPDGTVTTKVVLKKRFADGSEASSETVHTQRGQDVNQAPQDPFKSMQEAQASSKSESTSQETRRKGWFWS